MYPEAESYAHALQLGKLDRLDDRRVHLCYGALVWTRFTQNTFALLVSSVVSGPVSFLVFAERALRINRIIHAQILITFQ